MNDYTKLIFSIPNVLIVFSIKICHFFLNIGICYFPLVTTCADGKRQVARAYLDPNFGVKRWNH